MVPDHADPAPGLIVREVTLRNFRSYARLELALEPGLILVTGANGAGKTNLLEAMHIGTQGFSPRTRSDAQMLRFGTTSGRIRVRGLKDSAAYESDVVLSSEGSRHARLNGAALRSAESLRHELPTLVFTPDRLAVVKGGPAIRRAYLDRSVGRFFPGRSALPVEFAAAVGQRNAALRRTAAHLSSAEAIAPWTETVTVLGRALVEARKEVVAMLASHFSTCAEQLRLEGAAISYEGEAPSSEELESQLPRDLERGTTGMGPHLHDVRLAATGRDLRSFGSQGEQRTAVLALVLAEAAALFRATGDRPLVLLDDVLSELDGERRHALAEMIAADGQSILTATASSALPVEPAVSIVVTPGIAQRSL